MKDLFVGLVLILLSLVTIKGCWWVVLFRCRSVFASGWPLHDYYRIKISWYCFFSLMVLADASEIVLVDPCQLSKLWWYPFIMLLWFGFSSIFLTGRCWFSFWALTCKLIIDIVSLAFVDSVSIAIIVVGFNANSGGSKRFVTIRKQGRHQILEFRSI